MATATVFSSSTIASTAHCHLHHLDSESLPLIDLHLLSQSELLSLSLCSSSIHCLHNDADLSTPKIDRSVFNESAGSRKQTFSRLRLAPRSHNSQCFSLTTVPHRAPAGHVLDEENSQIVSLLKSLFGSKSDEAAGNRENNADDNLVSVPIQYNEFLSFPSSRRNEALQYNAVTVHGGGDFSGGKTEIKEAIPDSATKKRKRGRPRKNESNIYSNNVNDNLNQTTEIEEDKELERKGDRNAEEEAIALWSMEDPYGEELRRRTVGMHTREELVGFLEGLGGEWLSTKKKKKIVVASMVGIGDVLPSGWKLMLCIKKKAGYFWIACRRYISPYGQQFVSCKEVSSYLLSLSGLQDSNQSNIGDFGGNIQLTDKICSGNAADLTLRDGQNAADIICCSALSIASHSVEHENQAFSAKTGIPEHVQTVEKYKCHKCTMAFDESDDLLQHLLSSHQRAPKRLKHGTYMNEEAIIKNGKYECQFCHKPFEERHRYNGHLGNHIKDYFKRIEASSGVMTIQRSTVPPSVGVHLDVSNIQESFGVSMRSEIKINNEISYAAQDCKVKEMTAVEPYYGKQDIICRLTNDKVGRRNEVTDACAAESYAASALLNNEKDSICKFSGEANGLNCTTKTINNFVTQEDGSQNCSLTTIGRDKACVVNNNVDQVGTILIEEHYVEKDSYSGLLALNSKEKAVDGEIINGRFLSSSINGMETGESFVGKDKLRTGFGNNCSTEENVATENKEERISEGYSIVPSGGNQIFGSINDVNGLSTSIIMERTNERGFKEGLLSSLDETTPVSNNKVNQVLTCTVNRSKLDGVGKFWNNMRTVGFGCNSAAVEDPVIINEQESSSGTCSVMPSRNVQVRISENSMHVSPKCTIREPHQEKESECSQLNLFGCEHSFGSKSTVVNVSSDTTEMPNNAEVPWAKDAECSKNANVVAGRVTHSKRERSSNDFSLVPSGNEFTFTFKDHEVLNGTSKNLIWDRISESNLHKPDGQTLGNEHSANKVSCITMDQFKQKELKSFCDGEQQIAPDHGCMGQNVDVVKSKDRLPVIFGNQLKFDMEDSAPGLYSSTLAEQKRASVENFLSLSNSKQGWSVENNSDRVLTAKVQEGPKLEDLNPRKNETVLGFSAYAQTSENAISRFLWRTDEENVLLSGFADASSRIVHPSGCFPTYDLMSDKGESELFGEKFSGISGFEGLRSGSMENMEYNFMTSHSDESKDFSYNAELAQGLDSSVWLEKEALPLLPKIASRRPVPALCVWCRTEFYHEPLESEAQIGAIGFTCGTCKAKFSGQFNLL